MFALILNLLQNWLLYNVALFAASWEIIVIELEILITLTYSRLVHAASDFAAEDKVLTFTEDGPREFEFPVDIFQDAIAEGTEQFFVRLSSAPGETGVIFSGSYSQISIIDDDGKAIF